MTLPLAFMCTGPQSGFNPVCDGTDLLLTLGLGALFAAFVAWVALFLTPNLMWLLRAPLTLVAFAVAWFFGALFAAQVGIQLFGAT